jgi:hypothetical protein
MPLMYDAYRGDTIPVSAKPVSILTGLVRRVSEAPNDAATDTT